MGAAAPARRRTTTGAVMRATYSLITAGALLLAACDDLDDPGADSSFTGEMTGAHQATLDGEARFGVARGDGATGFTFLLGEGGAGSITLQWPDTSRPLEGQYEIVAPDFPEQDEAFHGTVGYVTGGALEEYEVRGGNLTITSSSTGTIEGSFELRAERTAPCCDPAPVQVFVTGNFVAKPVG